MVYDENLIVNPNNGDHVYTMSPFSLALLRFFVSDSFYYDVSMEHKHSKLGNRLNFGMNQN